MRLLIVPAVVLLVVLAVVATSATLAQPHPNINHAAAAALMLLGPIPFVIAWLTPIDNKVVFGIFFTVTNIVFWTGFTLSWL